MSTRMTIVALVDLPHYGKKVGEVFTASRPLAFALTQRGEAREVEPEAAHYHTRVMTPAPNIDRPLRKRKRIK